MKAKKTLTLILCMVLVAALSVAGTLAYLTSSDTVENTFTVGEITITLDEAKTDVNGEPDGNTRVDKNEYLLLPGKTYLKDPTVHVEADSEACYLFVKVENGIAGIEIAESATDHETIKEQILANDWIELEPGLYYYKDICPKNETEDQHFPVFGEFTVKADATQTDIEAVAQEKIIINAYAIQSTGFDSAADAWAAYIAQHPGA